MTEQNVHDFTEQFNVLPKAVLMFCRTGNRSNNLYQLAVSINVLHDIE